MLSGFLIALLAAAGWGGLDAVRKGLAAALKPVPLSALLAVGPILPFGVWALLLGEVPEWGYLPPGLASLTTSLLANVLFVQSLRLSPLSATIPMLSLTPVASVAGAALILGEQPQPLQLVGVVLVVGAALALPAVSTGLSDLSEALRTERGVPLMAGVAVLWSLNLVFDKAALAHATIPAHLLVQNGGVAVVLVALLAVRGRLGELGEVRGHLPGWMAAGALMTVAMALQLVAVQLLLVGVVDAVKRAVGLAMSAINGAVFFGEPMRWAMLPVLAAMAVGVILLVV
jgi:drug/metabolite transporter (DMT)-like permease